jgi:hypothetical protein
MNHQESLVNEARELFAMHKGATLSDRLTSDMEAFFRRLYTLVQGLERPERKALVIAVLRQFGDLGREVAEGLTTCRENVRDVTAEDVEAVMSRTLDRYELSGEAHAGLRLGEQIAEQIARTDSNN